MPQSTRAMTRAVLPSRSNAGRNLRTLLMLAGSAGALSACASIPDATVTYYRPKASVSVTVQQGVDCDASKTNLFVANSISASVTYTADRTQPVTFDLRQLDGWAADADMTFKLTDDGRLKTVNASSTGQGETVLKTLIPLASALGGRPPVGGAAPRPTLRECELIKSWNEGKPITLTYKKDLEFPAGFKGASAVLEPDASSRGRYEQIKAKLPILTVTAGPPAARERVVKPGTSSPGTAMLELTDTAFVRMEVTDGGLSQPWTQDVVIPIREAGAPYVVPVPKPALFGKQNIALELSDAGAVTTLTYGKTTGASGAAAIASTVESTTRSKSASDRAADLKAEADEMAQAARVARCRADPAACT